MSISRGYEDRRARLQAMACTSNVLLLPPINSRPIEMLRMFGNWADPRADSVRKLNTVPNRSSRREVEASDSGRQEQLASLRVVSVRQVQASCKGIDRGETVYIYASMSSLP